MASAQTQQQQQQQQQQQHFGTLVFQCDACNTSPITDVRYRCERCEEFDLCQNCYGANKHDMSHGFVRHVVEAVPPGAQPAAATAAASPGAGPPTERGSALGLAASVPAASAASSGQANAAAATAAAAVAAAAATGGGGAAATTHALSSFYPSTVERPIRRSTMKSSSNDSAIEKMDELLARCSVGPVAASHSSSQVATQLLELYEVGLQAMERHRRGKAQEQIVSRIAMALCGIPQRARRGSNFQPRSFPQPLEQDTVSGVMASFVTQLAVLDSDKVFSASKQQGADAVSLDMIQSNVESGVYFKRVESPEMALALFQRHIYRLFSQQQPSAMRTELGTRLDKCSRQAIDEIRDALGLSASFDADDTAHVTTAAFNSSSSFINNNSSSSSSIMGGNAAGGGGAGRAPTPDIVFPRTASAASGNVAPPNSSNPAAGGGAGSSSSGSNNFPFGSSSNAGRLGTLLATTGLASDVRNTSSSNINDNSNNNGGTSKRKRERREKSDDANDPFPPLDGAPSTPSSEASLRKMIKALKEDLDDAHSRIDVLVYLLRERVAGPLARGLDRAQR